MLLELACHGTAINKHVSLHAIRRVRGEKDRSINNWLQVFHEEQEQDSPPESVLLSGYPVVVVEDAALENDSWIFNLN